MKNHPPEDQKTPSATRKLVNRTMRAWRFILLVMLCGLADGRLMAAITVSETKSAQGQRWICVENDFYKLRFEPENGGRLGSLVLKSSGTEQASGEKHGGFFHDHFAGQDFPGEFMYAPYEAQVLTNVSGVVTLSMQRLAKGKTGDDATVNRKISDLLLVKKISVYENRPILDVEICISNQSDQTKAVGLWIQQCPALGGTPRLNKYYRPTVRGIDIIRNQEDGKREGGEDFVRNFNAGWMAGRNEQNNEGMVFLMDYDYLRILYNSDGQTAEWFMTDVPIPPGKSFTTQYSLVPVRDFPCFDYASKRLVAGIQDSKDGDDIAFDYRMTACSHILDDIVVETSLFLVRSQRIVKLADLRIPKLNFSVWRGKLKTRADFKEPVVLRVTVKGKDWSENFEHYYGGEWEGGGIAGYVANTEYAFARPKQNVKMLEADKFIITRNQSLDVLLFFGLYTQWYKIEETMRGLPGSRLKISNALFEGADYLPTTKDDWLQYDVVILSDVNMESLKDVGDVVISRFVENGGGLLVLGGPNTFGQGNFAGSDISKMLPVKTLAQFDVRWEKKGAILNPVGKHKVLEGIDFSANPAAYWIHECTAKDGSEEVLRAGNRPFLVLGRHGKGKIAVIAGTPMGKGLPGQVEFWQWPQWQKLLGNIIKWLGEEER